MAQVRADRVMESAYSTGTSAIVLAGALLGFQAFSAVMAEGDTCDYSIFAVDGAGAPTGEWETGTGTLTAGTLDRTTVQESSNANALVDFAAGTKYVMLSFNAASSAPSDGGGGGGGSGARSPVALGTLPALSTFTPYNIGGTIALVENAGKAISIVDSAPAGSAIKLAGMFRPAPSLTPYRVVMYIQPNNPMYNYHGVAWGFTDGAGNVEIISTQGGSKYFEHANFSGPTTRASFSSVDFFPPAPGAGFWAGVRDDGTNVWFEVSADGANFATIAKQAKSAGFLGSTGYTNIFVGLYDLAYSVSGADYPISMSILDYAQDGLTRLAGGSDTGGGGGGGASPYTKPQITDFPIQYNITSNCLLADADDGLVFNITGSGVSCNRGLIQNAPATPYSVTWKQKYLHTANNADDVIGIMIRDSATDKLITWGPNYLQNLCIQHWNSPTNYSGNDQQVILALWDAVYRFVDDGTNHLFQVALSLDGPWVTIFSQSRTAWLANPDQFGINIEEQSSHGNYLQIMQHWLVE